MKSKKCFALVDCNNFFVSCERVFQPQLNNKPVIVLSSNDGCVVSRSNEAKLLGIKMGEPYFKIKQFCENNKVHVFSSNFKLYQDMSKRIMKILHDFTPKMEIYSVDEAFLDLTGLENDLDEYCKEISNMIERWTGISVSIGIAHTKTLSKLASYIAKKEKIAVKCFLDSKELEKYLDKINIEDIWGIGKNLALRLRQIGIGSVRQLAEYSPAKIKSYFNINVERIVYELNNVSCIDLALSRPNKTIISSRSFGISVSSNEYLEEAISTYVSRAAIKLREQHSYVTSIHVYLETDFKSGKKRFSEVLNLDHPTNNTPTLISVAKELINKLYKIEFKYRKCGVVLMDLVDVNMKRQGNLFSDNEVQKNSVLMDVFDGINKKYGENAVQYASCGLEQNWKMKQNFLSDSSNNPLSLPKVF